MNHDISIIFAIGVVVLLLCCLAVMVRNYLEVGSGKTTLVIALALIAGVGAGLIRYNEPDIATPIQRWDRQRDFEVLATVFASLLTVITVIFLAKLHGKWIGGRLSENEKKVGLDGARAWLGTGNIICVALISLLAWLSLDYSPLGMAALGLMALLAYPALHTAFVSGQTAKPTDASSADRQRVLTMLDGGKINATEAAELLNALSISERPAMAKGSPIAIHKMALLGALLLLVGFFLPWFSFNPQSEMDRMAQNLPIDPNWTKQWFSNAVTMQSVKVSGGDIQHGLGWLILFLGVAAAALPYFAVGMQEETRRKVILAGLGVGSVVLLYLVTQNLRFVSVGIFLAVMGYALQLAGALQGPRIFKEIQN